MRQNTTFTHKLGRHLGVTGNGSRGNFVMQLNGECLDIDHKIKDIDH